MDVQKNATSIVYRTQKNEWILEKAGQTQQLLSLVKKHKIAYYGHVKGSNSLEKVIMGGEYGQ